MLKSRWIYFYYSCKNKFDAIYQTGKIWYNKTRITLWVHLFQVSFFKLHLIVKIVCHIFLMTWGEKGLTGEYYKQWFYVLKEICQILKLQRGKSYIQLHDNTLSSTHGVLLLFGMLYAFQMRNFVRRKEFIGYNGINNGLI